MKIAIVTTSFSTGPTSVKKYVHNILSFLDDEMKHNKICRISLITDNSKKIREYLGDKYDIVEIPTKIPNIKNTNKLGIMVLYVKMRKYIDKSQDIKIVFMPEIAGADFLPYLPLLTLKNKKVAITLHGVAPLILESDKMFGKNIFKKIIAFIYYSINKLLGKYVLKDVKAVIAVSHSEKRNICKVLNLPPEKIKVVYHGVSSCPRQSFPQKNKEKYFFHLSAYQPRKNVGNIIKAFMTSKKQYRIREKLVIGGKQPKYLERLAKEHYLTNEVVFLGYVSEDSLPQLYKNATAFIFPSFHEGFGMPLLEAMINKCPVITSNIFSMPEIVEKGGIFVNPSNIKEIANAMVQLSENPKLRKKLGELGFQRAKRFTWEKASKETFKVILRGVSNEIHK